MARHCQRWPPAGHTTVADSGGRHTPFSTDIASYTHTARSLACPLLVVTSRAFFLFFPCNHIKNIIKNSFSGEVKGSVIFPFHFLLHKRAKPIHPPYIHPSAHLSTLISHAAHPPAHLPIPPATHPPTKKNHGCTLKRARASFQKHCGKI
jgi:hypothetical protein